MKVKIGLLVLFSIAIGLMGCSNQDGRYNVKNSWCHEQITEKQEKITLSMDVLFKYNSASLNDISAEGDKQLTELVSYLGKNSSTIKEIKIVGYTDRIGSNQYNDKLGLERATTIKNYLAAHIDFANYEVESKGKLDPITDGCSNLQGASLISCLQPDRRVELFIERN